MKKVISVIILIAMVCMLEFNLFKYLLPDIYVWIESVLACGVIIWILAWNDILRKTK